MIFFLFRNLGIADENARKKIMQKVKDLQNTAFDEKNCKLCEENKADHVCIPCGHCFMCASCSQKYNRQDCAICKGAVNQVIKVLRSCLNWVWIRKNPFLLFLVVKCLTIVNMLTRNEIQTQM